MGESLLEETVDSQRVNSYQENGTSKKEQYKRIEHE